MLYGKLMMKVKGENVYRGRVEAEYIEFENSIG